MQTTQNLQTRLRYSDEDLKKFQEIIENKIKKQKSILEKLGYDETSSKVSDNPSGIKYENSAFFYNKEKSQDEAIRILKHIRDLRHALIRIGNKTFGICRVTGKLIPKERLKITPHATLSIEAKINRDK